MTNNDALYPLLPDENERLEALHSYAILDTAEEKDFDDLTTLASVICQVPIALVSFVDKDRQWFKSHKGLHASETPRDYSFCAHAIASDQQIMEIPDATQDPRFAGNPLVTGETNIVFYAGVPLISSRGFALGTLCVIDHHSKQLSAEQANALTVLAKQVTDKLELRKKTIELEAAHETIRLSHKQLAADHRKLYTSELKLRTLIHQASVAIAILSGPHHLIETANEKILEIWNKDPAVIGHQLKVVLPHLEEKGYFRLLADVYRGGEAYFGYENKVVVKTDAGYKDNFYNFVFQPLKNEEGATYSIIILATDITAQVVANRKLSAANERLVMSNYNLAETKSKLEQAIETGKMGTWSIDPVTYELTMSDFVKDMFGLPLDEEVDIPAILEAIDPEYRQLVQQALANAIEKHLPSDTEYSIVQRTTGEQKWVKATGKVFFDSEGVPLEYSGMFMDITERKLDEIRKNDFIGMVSHELKTPLTSLNGYIQILQMKIRKLEDDFLSGTLAKSAVQIKKMTGMINGFLNLSRLQSGKISLQKQHFLLNDLIRSVVEDVEHTQTSHVISFESDCPETIFADEDKIANVVSNFLSNAIKYSPAGKAITVRCLRIADSIQVSVQDEGMGIAADDVAHLFERYYRVQADHTQLISGFGIGLYLCAEIIEIHQGRIWVESTPGEGSTFYFSLPIHQAITSVS